MSHLLVHVSPRDPGVFLLVAALTASVALLSTWLPARGLGARRTAGSGSAEALGSR